MYATYLVIQLWLFLFFCLMLYIVEAVHWAKVRVRVRSQSIDHPVHDRKNKFR